MQGRVTRGNTLGKQADPKKPTSTKELVKKVGPPTKGTLREPRIEKPPPKSPAIKEKHKQVEVVIPVKKKFVEKAVVNDDDEFSRDGTGIILDKEADEEFARSLAELREEAPIPEITKVTHRPFDAVKPHVVHPIPRNQPRLETQDKDNPVKEKSVEDNGPKFNIRSGFHLPGVEEEVARKLFDAEVTLTSEELLALSRPLQKIMLRKARNVRVTPTKRKNAYVSTLLEDGTEVPEELELPRGNEFDNYISMDSIKLDSEEIFEVLEHNHNGLKAGSIVQRDPVEAFKADLPEGDERRNLVIVAGRSSSLRCINTKINHQDGTTEAILDSGCQIVAIDCQTAVELNLVWDPTVTIRLQDVHGGLEETAGLARNVPFQIGEITIYLQLHVQQRAPFDVLIGRPFDVLTESVIKNHADGSQEVTITDPNTGNKCTMGTHIRSTRRRLRTDNPEFKPKLVPEHAGSSNNPVKEEQGNF